MDEGRRGKKWWQERCQRIREMMKEQCRNPHDALLSVFSSLSLYFMTHQSSVTQQSLLGNQASCVSALKVRYGPFLFVASNGLQE